MTPDPARRDRLHVLAGGIALGIAGIHLYWGIPRFTAQATVGLYTDLRPLAFVLSGHAIVLAITLVLLGRLKTDRLYLPGLVLMVIHLVAYAAWHTVLSHGGVVAPSGANHSHPHESTRTVLSTIAWNLHLVLEHVENSPMALVSKVLELSDLLLLGYLYARNRRTPPGSDAMAESEVATSPQGQN